MSDVSRAFPKSLYVRPAVDAALEAYGELANLTLDTSDDAWTVNFADVDTDFAPDLLANEFANYVLAETINRRR